MPPRILIPDQRETLLFLEEQAGELEAFIRGLDSSSLREADSATAWFYRVLRNAIVDHYRRRGVESRVLEQVAAESSNEVQPDNELMQAVCSCVTTLLSTLKPEYAQAIRRVELDDVPVTTYAAEEQMTPNAAGVRLFRARQALKKRVIQSCGACSEHGCLDCRCGMKC